MNKIMTTHAHVIRPRRVFCVFGVGVFLTAARVDAVMTPYINPA